MLIVFSGQLEGALGTVGHIPSILPILLLLDTVNCYYLILVSSILRLVAIVVY